MIKELDEAGWTRDEHIWADDMGFGRTHYISFCRWHHELRHFKRYWDRDDLTDAARDLITAFITAIDRGFPEWAWPLFLYTEEEDGQVMRLHFEMKVNTAPSDLKPHWEQFGKDARFDFYSIEALIVPLSMVAESFVSGLFFDLEFEAMRRERG